MKAGTVWLLFAVLLLAGCRREEQKKITDEDLTVADFIAIAPALNFPVIVHDTTLRSNEPDSLKLNTKTFRGFLPDTVFGSFFPSVKNLKLYLLGKMEEKDKGNYVVLKSVAGKKRSAFLLYFDKDMRYIGGKEIANNKSDAGITRYCKIDSRFNITMADERKRNGELRLKETIYYMDPAGLFIMVMTNSNEDLSAEIRGNPIDTLPRNHKYSADYLINQKNMVSIRDGATEKSMQFFIHFSKQNDHCIGELKGEAEWVAKDKAVFRDVNSPCVIFFSFTAGAVRIQEDNGCGSYRDIKCFFEGSYPRKKEAVKKGRKR